MSVARIAPKMAGLMAQTTRVARPAVRVNAAAAASKRTISGKFEFHQYHHFIKLNELNGFPRASSHPLSFSRAPMASIELFAPPDADGKEKSCSQQKYGIKEAAGLTIIPLTHRHDQVLRFPDHEASTIFHHRCHLPPSFPQRPSSPILI